MLRRKTPKADAPSPAATRGFDELTYVLMYLAKVPIFSACSPDELGRVAGVSTVRNVDDGTTIVEQGQPGYDFFVILTGSARVTRDGTELAQLVPGDFFGELALFDPAPRNATVTATGPLSLVVLGRDAFRTVLTEAPIRDSVLAGMARRLHELDRKA